MHGVAGAAIGPKLARGRHLSSLVHLYPHLCARLEP